ncbi:MAG: hypothetical protein IT374_18130 [Polyangiaceae bacterium]|nr:hypothetical protein [Polyangiaceae bacterium]
MRRARDLGTAGLLVCASCTFGADEYRFASAASAGRAGAAGGVSAGAGGHGGVGQGGQAQGGQAQGGGEQGGGGQGGGAQPVCQPSDRACEGKQELACAPDRSKLVASRLCGPTSVCKPGVGCVTPVEVVAGVDSTCARASDGGVRCWGRNDVGQLGVGSVGGKHPVPREVVSPDGAGVLGGVTSLAVGWRSACAVAGGEVWCWGSDDNGQLGDGAGQTADSARPVKVQLPVKAAQVAGALLTFCALGVDDQVWCWGSNSGAIIGTSVLSSEIPVIAASIAQLAFKPQALVVGASAACVTGGGVARCWGLNLKGEAAIGATDSVAHAPAPVRVTPGDPPLAGVAQVAVGGASLQGNNPYSHVLLVTGDGAANGALWCWGWNDRGQCLVSPGVAALTTPQPVAAVSPVQVSAGGQHSCAAFASTPTAPNIQCWGWNEHGQIGAGTMGPAAVKAPFPVPIVHGATVSAGARHTCALGGEGRDTIWCWGDGADGQLGDGGFVVQPSPRVVALP